jgi:predicted amidohydrolase YtcJ
LQGWGDFKGILLHTVNDLCDMILQTTRCNFRIEVHAIGDAAAAQVLEAIQRAQVVLQFDGLEIVRPVLTHCQVLQPYLIMKMSELNVVANIQPSFVPTGMELFQHYFGSVSELVAIQT